MKSLLLALLTATDLTGLWVSETTYRPALRGELEIVRSGSQYRATIAGAEAMSNDLRFTFPRDAGEFRGTLRADGKTIAGFWLQPSGEGGSQPFATPMSLRRVRRGVWRGTVTPLDDRFTLFVKIFRNEQGILVGVVRNPERNWIGGVGRYRVTQDGDAVKFTSEDANAEARLVAPDVMKIVWRGRELELTRRAPEQVPAFFPRPPGEPKYVYQRPATIGDGWRTAAARDTSLDEAKLAALVQSMIDADPAARRPSMIHSLVVAHRGKLVLEEYFYGFNRETPHDTRSAGKTFSSVLLGAAMMRGSKLSRESRIVDVMAPLGPFANSDPRKSRITLAHLMTHTAGLACNDADDASPGNEGRMQDQTAQPNWWKYTLDLPMAHEPGKRYAYCSANTNLVGGALSVGTKTWLPALFDRAVARPLQFGRYYWNLMPTGEGYLGGGAYIRPRDLLKVGQVYLDGGVWNGKRIVPKSWVAQSTTPFIDISPETTGLSAEEFRNYYMAGRDALAWHGYAVTAGGRTYSGYAATGNGGQLLIVMPEVQLAVVMTGGNYMWGGIWGQWGQQIIGDAIIPAIR
jgi:CubicO group peptidase (beta-lactamase class C family)